MGCGLGAALPEDQIGLLWRLAPVLCLDGDAAGLDTGALKSHLNRQGSLEEIERIWRDALALHRRSSLQSEIESAWTDFTEDSSNAARDRVKRLEELGGAQGVTTRGNLLKPASSA